GTAAERAFADALEHLLEHAVEEHRLEVLALFAGLCGAARRCVALGAGERRAGVGRKLRGESDGSHHITSISAWIAPAALIACRIAIMSRGPMPSALRPSTSCCSDTPSLTSASFLPSSCTPTLVRGTTVVRPRASGFGWLTCADSEMVTVRLPCATATVDTRTSRP